MRRASDSSVDRKLHLKWKSEFAIHTDGYQVSSLNVWGYFFPSKLLDKIKDRQAGERTEVHLKAEVILPSFDKNYLVQVKRDKFGQRLGTCTVASPGVGRFYPKVMLKNVSGIFQAGIQPCRYVEISGGHMSREQSVVHKKYSNPKS